MSSSIIPTDTQNKFKLGILLTNMMFHPWQKKTKTCMIILANVKKTKTQKTSVPDLLTKGTNLLPDPQTISLSLHKDAFALSCAEINTWNTRICINRTEQSFITNPPTFNAGLTPERITRCYYQGYDQVQKGNIAGMKTEHLALISRTGRVCAKQRHLVATQRYSRLDGGRWAVVKLLMLLVGMKSGHWICVRVCVDTV